MKARILLALIVVAAATAIPLAFAQDETTRPPNVASEAWVPITDRLGTVLMAPAGSTGPPIISNRGALLLTPPAGGYFMVKDAGGEWRRLVIVEPLRGAGSAG